MTREVRGYSNAAYKRHIEESKTTMADDETPFFSSYFSPLTLLQMHPFT